MPTATMTSKGQITIPVEMRRILGLKPGVRIDFYPTENGEYAMRARTGSIKDLKGIFGKLGYSLTIEEMDRAVQDAVAENYLAGLRKDADEPGEAA